MWCDLYTEWHRLVFNDVVRYTAGHTRLHKQVQKANAAGCNAEICTSLGFLYVP